MLAFNMQQNEGKSTKQIKYYIIPGKTCIIHTYMDCCKCDVNKGIYAVAVTISLCGGRIGLRFFIAMKM
jgi:hypothetical protein